MFFASNAVAADERRAPRELIVLLDDLPSTPAVDQVVTSVAARRPPPGGLVLGGPPAAALFRARLRGRGRAGGGQGRVLSTFYRGLPYNGSGSTCPDSDCDGAGGGAELLVYGATGCGDPLSSPGCAPLASQFVYQYLPTTSMSTRRIYALNAVFKNTGSETWHFGGQSRPRSCRPAARSPSTSTSPAPSSPGVYGFQRRMVHECVEWFGSATQAPSITVSP